MIVRSLEQWRSLPHLRIDEAAALSGFCRRTVYSAMDRGELPSRKIGHLRVIPTAGFRRWIGDLDPSESAPPADPPTSAHIERKAERLMRRLG